MLTLFLQGLIPAGVLIEGEGTPAFVFQAYNGELFCEKNCGSISSCQC